MLAESPNRSFEKKRLGSPFDVRPDNGGTELNLDDESFDLVTSFHTFSGRFAS